MFNSNRCFAPWKPYLLNIRGSFLVWLFWPICKKIFNIIVTLWTFMRINATFRINLSLSKLFHNGELIIWKQVDGGSSSLAMDAKDLQKASSTVITFICLGAAGASYFIGRRLIPQILLLSCIGYLLSGSRYQCIYVIYKTLPRDLIAAARFARINILLWWWEKRDLTVPKVFAEQVHKHPNKVAFYCNKRSWTFYEVEEFSNRVAHFFKSAGFKRGETVAIFMESKPEYVGFWLGLSKVGIVAALINSNLRHESLIHSVKVANSRAIIFGSELASEVADIHDSFEGVSFYQFYLSGQSDNIVPGAVDLCHALSESRASNPADDIALGSCRDKLLYIYTSGTTGLPKAAVITHLRYMFMCIGVHYMLKIRADDVLYTPLPLYHTAGGMLGVGQALLRGASVAIRPKFSASNFWTDCITYGCTVAQYIGEMCRYLLSVPEQSADVQHKVRLMFGNGLRPQIWQQFILRFKIKQIGEFYGATEGNSNLVNIDNTVGAVGFVPRYAGNVYPVGLIKIDEKTGVPLRGENGLCMRCKPGEPGVFMGKINPNKAISSFSGYADQQASKKKIIHDVFAKGDQAFNSGDILIMDELGYFYFRDRTGDTFRWRGENVATSEVEAVISNVAGLKDCVVYGVEIPNVEGRAGMAALVDVDGTLNLSHLAKGMQENLPAYARPLFVRVLSHLPMTGTYKLKKKELQEESYNPNVIQDKLYFNNGTQFVPLTQQLYQDIASGKMRL